MALTKCPECRGQVSEQATACPHCGHPIAAASARSRAVVALAVGLLVVGIMATTLFNQKGGSGDPIPMVAVAVVVAGAIGVLLAVTLRRRSA